GPVEVGIGVLDRLEAVVEEVRVGIGERRLAGALDDLRDVEDRRLRAIGRDLEDRTRELYGGASILEQLLAVEDHGVLYAEPGLHPIMDAEPAGRVLRILDGWKGGGRRGRRRCRRRGLQDGARRRGRRRRRAGRGRGGWLGGGGARPDHDAEAQVLR